MEHPAPASRGLDGERRLARDIRLASEGESKAQTRGVQEPVATALSPLAEGFKPRQTSEEQQPRSSDTDNGLDRSLARTGSSKVETIWKNTERKIATIGKAGPIETREPVAVADVAEPPGPVGIRAGGPVVAGTKFTAVADRTGASGLGRSETGEPVEAETRIQMEIAVAVASGPAVTGAGGSVGADSGLRPGREIAEAGGPAGTGAGSPFMVENRFLTVADVHALFEDRKDDPPSDLGKFEPVPGTVAEVTRPQPLGHTDVMKEVALKKESGSEAQNTDSEVIGEASDGDQVGSPFLNQSPSGENSLWDTDGARDIAEGDGNSHLWEHQGRPEWRGDRPMEHPAPASRGLDGERRLARDIRLASEGESKAQTRGVQEPVATALSPLAESFKPRQTSEEQQPRSSDTDNGLDRSLARTGSSKVETIWKNTERKIATIGKAGPIETREPVVVADVAEPPGPVGIRAGGPVVAGTKFTAVADRTGASGLGRSETGEPVEAETRIQMEIAVAVASGPAVTGAGGSVGADSGLRPGREIAEAGGPAGTGAGSPFMVENRFLTVADVHALFEDRKDDPPSDLGKFEPVPGTVAEVTRPQPLGHTDVMKEVALKKESGSEAQNTDSEVIGEASDGDQVGSPFLNQSPGGENSLWDTDGARDIAEGDAIMVGAVGSVAPWFLTGWTNDVEVEFMIDTGCQVTILATSVFKRMCEIHPQLGAKLVPCTQRLVSADSSPLFVLGRINLNIVFPGLRCDMCCVVASIGSDGLLGTEALQSCLPHQLDLRTGQLWADGRSTLQLHQQKPTPTVSGSLITAVVLPPDSEVVANFSIDGGQLGTCALINPNRDLTEDFGVIVGHTLVDATTPSASVLIINPNAEEVVLPCGAHIGDLVPVLAVSVARSD